MQLQRVCQIVQLFGDCRIIWRERLFGNRQGALLKRASLSEIPQFLKRNGQVPEILGHERVARSQRGFGQTDRAFEQILCFGRPAFEQPLSTEPAQHRSGFRVVRSDRLSNSERAFQVGTRAGIVPTPHPHDSTRSQRSRHRGRNLVGILLSNRQRSGADRGGLVVTPQLCQRQRLQIEIVGEHRSIVSGTLRAECDRSLHGAGRRAKLARLQLQLAKIVEAGCQSRWIWRAQSLSSPHQVFREKPHTRVGPSTILNRRFHERVVQAIGIARLHRRALF